MLAFRYAYRQTQPAQETTAMYVPDHFKVEDNEEIFSFIDANAFGQLISVVDDRPFASHLPFLITEDRKSLQCHLARSNPHWQNLEGKPVLVTFLGPHDYISPSWYKQAGVPTWNYQAVHIYGRGRVFDDAGPLADLVEALSHRYESAFETPWQPKYREAMLKAIIGVEITIDEVQAKYKLSQNRPVADQAGVIDSLDKLGADTLADAMRKASD
jgi:transcriptional regulator